MLIIPAIDLKDGRCVRLRQGDMQQATEYSDDPLAMAEHWAKEGARRLHLVDLDGAVAGVPCNRELIRELVAMNPGLPVQLGGGIRSEQVISDYLEAGVRWVIIGTRAVEKPEFIATMCRRFPGRIMVGLDARQGRLATHGWTRSSAIQVLDLAHRFAAARAEAIIYTDIDRDGMGTGINLEATRELAAGIDIPVIASGGVRNLTDVQNLLKVHTSLAETEQGVAGLLGVITGRAIYEGTLDFATAQARCDLFRHEPGQVPNTRPTETGISQPLSWPEH